LAHRPLYISFDKDMLTADEATVNWDSGYLHFAEAAAVLDAFTAAAGGQLAGADTVGDWSPVVVEGWFRRLFHLTEHPPLTVDPADALRRNEPLNLQLLDRFAPCRRASAGRRDRT
jgi:hypothetical protein